MGKFREWAEIWTMQRPKPLRDFEIMRFYYKEKNHDYLIVVL